MELKPGYKQTELGMIPEDWVVKPLFELFAFSGGYSASRAQLSNEGHCYLHYGDIHGTSKTTVDTSLDYSDIPKLYISLSRVSRDSLLDDGDVVFVDASEDDEGAQACRDDKQRLPAIHIWPAYYHRQNKNSRP